MLAEEKNKKKLFFVFCGRACAYAFLKAVSLMK